MKSPPLEMMASWPKPNYTNPRYQGSQLLVVGVVLLIVSSIMLGLRLWVRIQMKRSAGWDDSIMVAAILFIICSTVTANLGTKYGLGYHVWDQRPEWARPSLMAGYFNQLLLVIIMTLVKLSLLTSFLRFFTVRTSRYLSWALIVVILGWGLSFLIAMLITCRPLRAYWDTALLDSGAECSDEQARTLAFTITNVIFDFVILILPVPTFWKLQLPIRERACAASAVRLYYANRIYHVSYDVTWDGYQLWLWVLVEINLAVISASIPTIRPLVRKFLPQLGFRGSSYTMDTRTHVTQNNTHTSGGGGARISSGEQDSTEALWSDDSFHMISPLKRLETTNVL
ncbi:hypothetical protein BJX76DRAFT_361400 [Aspergillus varians]